MNLILNPNYTAPNPEKATKLNLIRSNEIYLDSLEEIDDEVETNNDDQNSWFNKENNDNVDGDKTVLENDNWVDPKVNIDHNNFENMHGVVKQEVGEMDRFLGRNPERKPTNFNQGFHHKGILTYQSLNLLEIKAVC